MCGLVGYIGKNKTLPILIKGLKKLEYRGYDSAGIAYIDGDNVVKISKAVGRISELEKKVNFNSDGNLGIGHTRWATHGVVSVNNAHPHKHGKITLVHNGIIENYLEIKQSKLHSWDNSLLLHS